MNAKGERFNVLICAILALIGMTFLQHTPELIDQSLALRINSVTKNSLEHQIDVSTLPVGDYIVSLGRPRAHCDISLDSEILFKGKSTVEDRRVSLLAAGAFHQAGNSKLILIDCKHNQSGFIPRLSFIPKIYNYTSGMAVQLYRASIDMFIGPIGALLLLISSAIYLLLGTGSEERSLARRYVFYASIAVVYSLSLAYYTRMFFDGLTSSYMHVVLRIVYSLSFNLLLQTSTKNRIFLLTSHTLAVIGMFFLNSPTQLENYYRTVHVIMPIATLWTFIDLLQLQSKTRDVFFLQIITLSWAIAQFMDTIKLNSNVGFYAAPLYMMLISMFLIYRIFSIQKRNLGIQSLSASITESLRKSKDIQQGINSVLRDLSIAIPNSRMSCYVDEFILGATSSPGASMIRISDAGFNSIERNSKLNLLDEDSPTRDSLQSGEPIVRTGKIDNIWFIIVPIAGCATINISFTKKTQSFYAFEALEVVKKLMPSLNGVKTLFDQHGYKMNSSLAKLRPQLGDGIHELETGAIFIDIADYSKFTEEYGDSYAGFISSEFFPSLIKHMSSYAIPEVVRGDEAYFVISDHTSSHLGSISVKTSYATAKIFDFLTKISPDICTRAGFPVVDFRIGVTVGPGAIVVDDVQVRTSGDHINKAKRLQDAATRGEILTDESSFNKGFSSNLVSISKKTIVVKKNVIEAVKVGVKRAA